MTLLLVFGVYLLFLQFQFQYPTLQNTDTKTPDGLNINSAIKLVVVDNRLNYILRKDNNQVDKSVVLNRSCTHIDAVYTWVNGSDLAHMEKRTKAGFNVRSDVARYREIGALKYSLRSLSQNAPWIKNIWIITDSQIPDFFNTSSESNIKFIFHESFFNNRSHLPTFNSVSIESNFYNLPEEVSNCFLYFNDDVFLKTPVKPTDFFFGDKEQVLFEDLDTIGGYYYRMFDKLDAYHKSLVLSAKLLDRVFNITEQMERKKSDHGVQVFDRRVLIEMQQKLEVELDLASSHKTRDNSDPQFHFLYNQFAKKYQNSFTVKNGYNFYGGVTSNMTMLKTTLYNAVKSPAKVICLNDGLDYLNYSEPVVELTSFYNGLFPNPGSWELVSIEV
ncbi:hypothetical protein CYY_005190 [Polysphondylium violaceum]|uniref:Glycophosphotransferase n=1 Tax=Polysphondylium violaceum TaxID=133409 RepID=A0A8J4Q3R3_9MYCE|nr:hypothetical protein CYY_005190 [Polysphondylium violaceum]